MKKSVLSLIIAICLMLPCALIFNGCQNEDKSLITYKWGDQVYEVQEIEKGSKLDLLGDPEKSGYNFYGWYSDEDCEYKFNPDLWTSNGQNLTLYAKYDLISYRINYHLSENENKENNPDFINVETSLTLQKATKDNYRFMGWYSDANFTTKVDVIEKGTISDINLYPKFLRLYSIIYVGIEPLQSWTTEFTVEDTITLPQGYDTDTMEFYCWSNTDSGSVETTTKITEIPIGTNSDFVVYARGYKFVNVEYDLDGKCDANNPSKLSSYQKNILKDAVPYPGYLFKGWYCTNTQEFISTISPTEPLTEITFSSLYDGGKTIKLKAICAPIDYQIEYVLNDGTNDIGNPSKYTVEDKITLKDATKEGYVFIGWYTEPNFKTLVKTIDNQTESLVLYAKFAKLNEDGYYEINSVSDLRNLAVKENAAIDVVLNKNIDLNGEEIYIQNYSGIFNGNGYTISNCSIALFGKIENATVKNLNVTINVTKKGSYIQSTYIDACTGFINYALTSTIENCSVNGAITCGLEMFQLNSADIGGLVGYTYNSSIKNCLSDVDIVVNDMPSGGCNVGGLIGALYVNSKVENCCSYGSISINNINNPLNAGGLIGNVISDFPIDDTMLWITNSYSTVDIELNTEQITSSNIIAMGGLIGKSAGMTFVINGCYATGNIVFEGNAGGSDVYVNGFIAFQGSSTEVVTDCYTYSGQKVEGESISDPVYNNYRPTITSTTMQDIWAYVCENWDDEVWQLSRNAHPILK